MVRLGERHRGRGYRALAAPSAADRRGRLRHAAHRAAGLGVLPGHALRVDSCVGSGHAKRHSTLVCRCRRCLSDRNVEQGGDGQRAVCRRALRSSVQIFLMEGPWRSDRGRAALLRSAVSDVDSARALDFQWRTNGDGRVQSRAALVRVSVQSGMGDRPLSEARVLARPADVRLRHEGGSRSQRRSRRHPAGRNRDCNRRGMGACAMARVRRDDVLSDPRSVVERRTDSYRDRGRAPNVSRARAGASHGGRRRRVASSATRCYDRTRS